MSNAKDEDVLILDFVNDSVIPNPKLSVSFQCSSQWLTVLLRFRHQSQLNGRFDPLSHCLIYLWADKVFMLRGDVLGELCDKIIRTTGILPRGISLKGFPPVGWSPSVASLRSVTLKSLKFSFQHALYVVL